MTNVYDTPTPFLLGPVLLFLVVQKQSLLMLLRSYVLAIGVHAVHKVDALLVHGEDDAAAQDEPRQPRQGAAPEREDALVLEDHGRAAEAVAVHLLGLDALHARLDRVQRLRHVDGDQAGQPAHGERAHGAQLLARRRVRLRHLLEEVVRGEACGAVGGLPRRRGDEALEEASKAALARNDGHGVEEAAHARFGRFSVVDTTARCQNNGQHKSSEPHNTHSVVLMLSNGVTASSDSVTPAPKPAITVRGPEMLPSASASIFLYWSNATNPAELPVSSGIEVYEAAGSHTYSCLQRVSYDEGGASCIPLLAEGWPWQLLAVS